MIKVEQGLDSWMRYMGVDNDGTANYFHKKPEMVAGYFIPSEFRDKMYQSSAPHPDNLSKFAGSIFKRRTRSGEYFWEMIHES